MHQRSFHADAEVKRLSVFDFLLFNRGAVEGAVCYERITMITTRVCIHDTPPKKMIACHKARRNV